MTTKRYAALAVATCLVASLFSATAQQMQPIVPAHPAQRDLWLGERERFIRQWMLLGPVSEADANALAAFGAAHGALDIAPGREQKLASGASPRWRPQTSWGDNVTGFGSEIKSGDHAFAAAAIERSADGAATLMLGGNVRGAWVNGAWVAGFEDADGLIFDARAANVRLVKGTNRILLRLKRLDRPMHFAARVVEPGFSSEFANSIDPFIRVDPANPRRVALGAASVGGVGALKYEVVGAGGRIAAERRAARGEVFTLDATDWPEGAYEIRVSAQNANSKPAFAHRAWFHGDVLAAARRLLAAADAPDASDQLRMLGTMVRDRAGKNLEDDSPDARAGLHSPLMEYEELLLEAAGKTGGARASGFVRLAWRDDTDGSTQYCRAYLPANYSPSAPSPAVVSLHGFNPQNPEYVRWWSVSERHDAVAERQAVILLYAHGRGNVGYSWMGKRDVMRCLAEAQKKFNIDADRVYLTGESMGGSGTWIVAQAHPEVFAAVAPVFGGWDFRINPNTSFGNVNATRPLERYVYEFQASFLGTEALLNVPVFVLHGDQDPAVTVEYSRHVVRMMQRWGYDVRYQEIPGRVHEDLNARDEIVAWMLKHKRKPAREVRLRALDLTTARAHWVQVTGWQQPLDLIQVRAEILESGFIRLDTQNVASLTLSPPPELASAPSRKFVVDWQGVRSTHDAGAPIRLTATPADAPRALDKRPGLDGRLSSFFDRPFAIVVGTTSRDADTRELIASKADTLIAFWQDWQKVRPRVLKDTEVTAEHERTLSLFLIGGADANAVTARRASKLPLKVAADSVSIDGRRFAAKDAVTQLLYPNPVAPDHYLFVVASTSREGMYFWAPANLLAAGFGVQLQHADWTIADGRRINLARGLGADRALVASGIFDRHWRRNDAWVYPGDADLRAAAKLRRAPAPDYRVSTETLDSYVGSYAYPNGYRVRVERRGDALFGVDGPNVRPLRPESPDDFVDVLSGSPLSFLRDASGKVTAVVANMDGQDVTITRRDD
jgi:poly(3-hydroxybutyrate) depolymerase